MTATPVKSESPHQRDHQSLYPLLLAAVICVLIVCGTVTFQSIQRIRINSDLVAQTHENLRVLDRLESSIKDAESSQRGYIITGDKEYLQPFHNAADSINQFMQELEQRTTGDDQRQKGIETLKLLIRQKMDEMQLSITLRRESIPIAAENVVRNDTARQFMDEIREQLISIRSSHDRLLGERAAASNRDYVAALLTALGSTIVGLSLVAAVFWTVQDSRKKMEAATAVLFTERERLQVTFASIGDGGMRDLTSAKTTQDELSELATRLSEMDRRKNEFLATLAHELRIPLAPIRNAVQLMGMLKLDPEIDELRQMMDRQVEQLVRLIDDLLDVSGISRGKIALRSETVELPAIIDAGVVANLSSSSPLPAIMAEAVSARSFKVLIVEDMRALRVITARLLEKLGHEVEFVENGPLALLKLDTFTPDVVFSDIAMPGMTGYELARRIRQRSDCSRVCLVALTGFGQSSDRDKALEAGFHEHMVKPVDIAVLQSLFEKLTKTVAA